VTDKEPAPGSSVATDEAIRAKGQHYLDPDGAVTKKIVAVAALKPGETVLDIGAGRGALTKPLCEAVAPGGNVVAIETEPEMIFRLKRLGGAGLHVLAGDVLRVELPARVDAIVANPPYRILPAIMRRLLDHGFGRAVLVVPMELAQRLTAQPKTEHYGRLTVQIGYRAKVELLFSVGRRAFDPPPAVASATIKVIPKPIEATAGVPPEILDAVLDAAWEGRAKTLRHALAPLAATLGLPPQDITEAIATINGDGRRFADISVWEWSQLARHLGLCQQRRSA
jgi:16S rRNA (adenine1518-N6/adenine1519-N6)-dimethyltransferase